jgi:hypothetical protein
LVVVVVMAGDELVISEGALVVSVVSVIILVVVVIIAAGDDAVGPDLSGNDGAVGSDVAGHEVAGAAVVALLGDAGVAVERAAVVVVAVVAVPSEGITAVGVATAHIGTTGEMILLVIVKVATIVMMINMREVLPLRATVKGDAIGSIVLPGFVVLAIEGELVPVAIEVTAVVVVIDLGEVLSLGAAGQADEAAHEGFLFLLVNVVLIGAELGVLHEVDSLIVFVIEMTTIVVVVEVLRAAVTVKMATIVVVVHFREVLPLSTAMDDVVISVLEVIVDVHSPAQGVIVPVCSGVALGFIRRGTISEDGVWDLRKFAVDVHFPAQGVLIPVRSRLTVGIIVAGVDDRVFRTELSPAKGLGVTIVGIAAERLPRGCTTCDGIFVDMEGGCVSGRHEDDGENAGGLHRGLMKQSGKVVVLGFRDGEESMGPCSSFVLFPGYSEFASVGGGPWLR